MHLASYLAMYFRVIKFCNEAKRTRCVN